MGMTLSEGEPLKLTSSSTYVLILINSPGSHLDTSYTRSLGEQQKTTHRNISVFRWLYNPSIFDFGILS